MSYIPPDKKVKPTSGPFGTDKGTQARNEKGEWVAEMVETPPGPKPPKSSPTPVPTYGSPIKPRMQRGSV